MKALFIEEPELEFGGGGRHIDVRYGLRDHGPLDRGEATAPAVVRVGVVGEPQSVEQFRVWVDQCREGVEAKPSSLHTLYPAFPGFGEVGAFCDMIIDDRLCDVLSRSEGKLLHGTDGRRAFANALTDRLIGGAASLIEKNADVVCCLPSPEALKRIDVPEKADRGPRSSHRHLGVGNFVWHDLFKAAALGLGRPVQVVRPATYNGGVWKYRRTGQAIKALQDEATRAWNVFCALYYKGGGLPWRLPRDAADLTACHVGVSFYRESEAHDQERTLLRTSVAQVFNERGEGMVVRGGPGRLDPDDRTPHLTSDDIRSLVENAVKAYRRDHRNLPARLSIHKTTYFDKSEIEGCELAVDAMGIDALDLISMPMSRSTTRLFRGGSYAPLRGTALVEEKGARCFLYTQGSVDFYRCYPGLYVPRTLEVRRDLVERGPQELLLELLALTKLNWNSTGLANSKPVTLAAAERVGNVLRHVPQDQPLQQANYSFFM